MRPSRFFLCWNLSCSLSQKLSSLESHSVTSFCILLLKNWIQTSIDSRRVSACKGINTRKHPSFETFRRLGCYRDKASEHASIPHVCALHFSACFFTAQKAGKPGSSGEISCNRHGHCHSVKFKWLTKSHTASKCGPGVWTGSSDSCLCTLYRFFPQLLRLRTLGT